ncbi:MAG: beta strand repeat-containing protein, partial [Janthinobacterium lividum]
MRLRSVRSASGSERTLTNVAAGQLSATSTDAVNGSQLYATNQALNNLSTSAAAGWNISADGTNATSVGTGSTTGNTLDLSNTDGNLVVAKSNTSNDVTFDLADDVTINNSLTVGGTTLNQAGLQSHALTVNASGATYTGPITNGDHIANKSYVDQSVTSATADVNLQFAGNSGNAIRRNNGEQLSIRGDATTAGTYEGSNLQTVTDDTTGEMLVQMARAPRFGNVVINDGDSGRITGVSNGVLSDTSTDAVNGSQLYATNQALNNLNTSAAAGWNISADGTNATSVGTGSTTGNTLDLSNTDGNLVVAKSNTSNDVTFDLADDVTINNSLTVGGTTLNQAGLQSHALTVNASGATYTGPITNGDHIANKSYVDQSVTSATADVNLQFAGNSGNAIRRNNGEQLIIRGDATTAGTYEGSNLQTVTDDTTGEMLVQMA